MFSIRKKKNRSGFILVYVLFIGSICLSIAASCYKTEYLIRKNSLNFQKYSLKVNGIQKQKEYLLTQLDQYIYKNINDITEDEIKKYFQDAQSFSLSYEQCYVTYFNSRNCFLLVYYLNNKFYKEELYEYKVVGDSVNYGCIDYSFKKGDIK